MTACAHAERDDLRICDPAAGVSWPFGQEIVCRAENRGEAQVEVGVHRGLPVDGDLDTADFDHSSKIPRLRRAPWKQSSRGRREAS